MALTIYKYAIKGYKKGLSNSIIEFAIVLVCVFLSALISVPIVNLISDAVLPTLIETVLGIILGDLGMYQKVVNLVFKMILSLLIYLPVFLIFKTAITIVISIIKKSSLSKINSKNLDYYKENEEFYVKKQKVISAFVGVLTGFAIFIITMSPLCGALKSTYVVLELVNSFTSIETIEESSEDGTEEPVEESEDLQALKSYSNDFIVNFITTCGGDSIFRLATSITVDGAYTNLTQELDALKVINISEISSVVELISSGNTDSVEIKQLLTKIKKSKILQVILVETIRGASNAWLSNEEFMGVARPNLGNFTEIDSFVDEILYVCSNTNTKSVSNDLETLINVSTILINNFELFSDAGFDSVLNELSGNGLITQIKDELLKNPNMYPVVMRIDSLVMKVVANEIQDFTKYSSEDCDILYNEIVKIMLETSGLNGSVKITSVSNSFVESLANYGIEIPEELSEEIATQLIEGLSVYGEEINYDVVKEYFESFSNDDISNFIPQEPQE